MPPSTSIVSSVVVTPKNEVKEAKYQQELKIKRQPAQNRFGFVTPLVWPNIIMIIGLHLYSLYTLLYMLPMHFCKWQTICFGKYINIVFLLDSFYCLSETYWRCLNSR